MPTVTYMLELTDEELSTLWAMVNFLDAMAGGISDRIEKDVLDKIQRLMEGR
jgi:hypothetical protein